MDSIKLFERLIVLKYNEAGAMVRREKKRASETGRNVFVQSIE